MKALVTGGAGFIGSHLSERLLAQGAQVRAIDAFTDFYPRPLKERNLAGLRGKSGYEFVEGDLRQLDLPALLDGITHVFHLAAQAGVRRSWGAEFSVYTGPDQRRRGAGRLAMEALLAAAEAAGFWKLLSRVFVENAPSRALLASLGFREVGVYEKHGQLDGDWRDVVIVERLIPANLERGR